MSTGSVLATLSTTTILATLHLAAPRLRRPPGVPQAAVTSFAGGLRQSSSPHAVQEGKDEPQHGGEHRDGQGDDARDGAGEEHVADQEHHGDQGDGQAGDTGDGLWLAVWTRTRLS